MNSYDDQEFHNDLVLVLGFERILKSPHLQSRTYFYMLFNVMRGRITISKYSYSNYRIRLQYMKIHVPSMLAKGVETTNEQTQQTSSHNEL